MIPQAYITEWANQVPWQTNEQVEQDLVICRALVEIFSDEFLAKSLLEELLGTKLRALYQRRKGRDLYDMYKALVQVPGMDKEALLHCYHAYMDFVVDEPPTQKVYLQNMEAKMQDDEFIGDLAALIRPTEKYDQATAFDLVRTELLEKIDERKLKQRRNGDK